MIPRPPRSTPTDTPFPYTPLFRAWKGVTGHRPRFRALPQIAEARAARAWGKALRAPLRALCERCDFDIIDAEFFWPDGVAAMHLSQESGVPFSIKARGADIHYWGSRPGIAKQIVAAAQAANGLLAVSEALKRDMATLGMPERKIRVHYTGIDLDRFKPIDRRAAKARLEV